MDFRKFLPREFVIDGSKTKTGSEGYVQKGSHPVHGDVAIKRYFVGCCNSEATLLMQNANHKNIVELIGILIDDQSQWIGYVMPYMSRGNLYENKFFLCFIHNKTGNYNSCIYTSEQVTRWITYIANALSFLHSNSIIHRDIKPSNVLLGKSYDDVKLSDFGIARPLETITHNLTTGVGSPIYMAPEIFKGEYYDTSVDIYSLAITIWEILHRRVPFDHAMVKSLFELQIKISEGMRPEIEDDLSGEVSGLLMRCWNADISLRPQIKQIQKLLGNTQFNIPGGDNGSIYYSNMFILTNNEGNRMDWKQLDIQLPYALRAHGAQFLNNYLYIFGGQKVKNEVSNSMHKLSKKLQWEKMMDVNEKRSFITSSSFIFNYQIWICGGWDGMMALKSVEMYDPVTDTWEEMNECRRGAAASLVEEKIFCCGGWDGFNHLDSAEFYDPFSDVWTLLSVMPSPNVGFGVVSIDDSLIIMGGWTGEKGLDDVWMLDTTNDNAVWIEKQKMPRSRETFSIAKIDGKIFVCGGVSNSWVSRDVDIFDGETWRNGPMLKVHNQHAAATVIPVNFAKHLEYGNTRFQTTQTKTISQQFDETIKVSETIRTNTKKETILLMGGDDGKKYLDSLLILGNSGEQWKEAKVKLPFPIFAHGAQFVNNHLYIFGGNNRNNEYLNSTYKLSKRFQRYTLSNIVQWEKMTDMNEKRSFISSSSIILNGWISVCGGRNGTKTLKSVEMYNPETNEWKRVRDMNVRRASAAAAVVNGKIFCCGGDDGKKFLSSVECYDPSSRIWILICPMPESLRRHSIVDIDKNLVAMGGWIEGDCSNNVWGLDTSDNNAEWIEKPKMSLPRGEFSIAKIDNKVFVCGGRSREDITENVEIFNGEVWRNGPKLTTVRYLSASTVIPADFAKCLK